jgi:hypothetical protein
MSLFHRAKEAVRAAANPRLPYGEPGTTEYWIEVFKRACELGEMRAQQVIDELVAETGPHPPRSFTDGRWPGWFTGLWFEALHPACDIALHHLRMPY